MGTCPQCEHEGPFGQNCPEHPDHYFADKAQLASLKDHNLLLGELVAKRFAITRLLGQGGMGRVYEGVDLEAHRKIALKLLRADHINDEVVRARFFREAKILGLLDHPNLVTLYDHGEVEHRGEESLYIAMELLHGATLQKTLERKTLGAAAILSIAKSIASGLGEAHKNGIVHRDLKPDNVLLVRIEGQDAPLVKLVDFGIARMSTTNTVLTQAGLVFGTPAYMSPEQATAEPDIRPPADVYAFGVLLYRMMTGKLPFAGESPLQMLMGHVNTPPPPIILRAPLTLPRSLIDLTLHCLEKKPRNRPQSGAEVLATLHQVEADLLAGTNLVEGAEQADESDPRLGEIGTLSSPDPLAETADDTETDAPNWLVGGDVELVTVFDRPAAPNTSDKNGLSKAYRVSPKQNEPSPLKLRKQPLPNAAIVGAIVAFLLLLGLLWALSRGNSHPELPATDVKPQAPPDPGTNGVGDGQDPATAPETVETPAKVNDPLPEAAAPDDTAQLLRSLESLKLREETTLTIVDDRERRQLQRELREQIRVLREELRSRGVAVP